MTLGLLSIDNFKLMSKVSSLKAEDDDLIQTWISLADNLISSFELDSSRAGFNVNVAFAIQKTAEYLYIQNEEDYISAINSPFKYEKFGSYSYTRFDVKQMAAKSNMLIDFLPPVAASIINIYMKTHKPISVTTHVFDPEFVDYIKEINTKSNISDRYVSIT